MMKKYMSLLMLLFGLAVLQSAARAQSPINTDLISRVVEIRVPHGQGFSVGTAFVVDYQGWQYLVTAERVVAGLPFVSNVDVYVDSKWQSSHFTIWHGDQGCNDVAVLEPPFARYLYGRKIEDVPLEDHFAMGQELYFLGYPYALFSTMKGYNRPVPFVKHGYVSGIVPCSTVNPNWKSPDENLIAIDALANPGFSGGPVVYRNYSKPGNPLTFMGVVSKYKFTDPSEDHILSPRGQIQGLGAVSNSGIMYIVGAQAVTNLLQKVGEYRKKSEQKK